MTSSVNRTDSDRSHHETEPTGFSVKMYNLCMPSENFIWLYNLPVFQHLTESPWTLHVKYEYWKKMQKLGPKEMENIQSYNKCLAIPCLLAMWFSAVNSNGQQSDSFVWRSSLSLKHGYILVSLALYYSLYFLLNSCLFIATSCLSLLNVLSVASWLDFFSSSFILSFGMQLYF